MPASCTSSSRRPPPRGTPCWPPSRCPACVLRVRHGAVKQRSRHDLGFPTFLTWFNGVSPIGTLPGRVLLVENTASRLPQRLPRQTANQGQVPLVGRWQSSQRRGRSGRHSGLIYSQFRHRRTDNPPTDHCPTPTNRDQQLYNRGPPWDNTDRGSTLSDVVCPVRDIQGLRDRDPRSV